ncbi:hypothetical protein KA005_74440 [bacterium]|nr:hypothetical protein [bacterium]
MSNKKRRIPIPITHIGKSQQQPFDISEAISKSCEQCGGAVFDQAVKLGLISKLSSKNRTGQDVLVKFEVYLCRNCGHEYGQEG